jgi:hypothetical protein
METVAGQLQLTPAMIEWCDRSFEYDNLHVHLLSLTDIFGFKPITEREGDLEDAALITRQADLDSVELPGISLPALIVVQGDLLHDAGIDELLDMLVDGGLAHAGVECLEFVHRGELLWVGENIADERKPRLLCDEVDKFPWCRLGTVAQTSVHTGVFDRGIVK